MMNVWVLITGNFLVMLLSLYPLEAVRPGWLDGKKALKFSMPYVGTIAFYFLGTWLAGDGIFHLSGFLIDYKDSQLIEHYEQNKKEIALWE